MQQHDTTRQARHHRLEYGGRLGAQRVGGAPAEVERIDALLLCRHRAQAVLQVLEPTARREMARQQRHEANGAVSSDGCARSAPRAPGRGNSRADRLREGEHLATCLAAAASRCRQVNEGGGRSAPHELQDFPTAIFMRERERSGSKIKGPVHVEIYRAPACEVFSTVVDLIQNSK